MSADVILASGGGGSLTGGLERVTAERIDQFRPDPEAKAAVARALEDLGFNVHDAGVTLTIEGDPELFERALGMHLDVKPDAPPGEPIVAASGEPQLPAQLRGQVERVVFPRRAHLFRPAARGKETHGEG